MLPRRLLSSHKLWCHVEPFGLRTRRVNFPLGVRQASGNVEQDEALERPTIPPTIIEKAHKESHPEEDTHAIQDSLADNRPTPFQQSFDPTRTHQFDTFKLVSALQRAGYSHMQAIALMKCLRTVLVSGTEVAKLHYLSRGDLENETYLFRAAMSELRTEVKTLRHNESAAERAEIIQLQKDLDSLNQQTREDLENLRNDVTIEMNNRKIATRAEQQMMEIKIQDLNNNFTKRLADMRTEAEAQKWQTTRFLIVTLITMTILGFGVTRYIRHMKSYPPHTSEGVQTDPSEPREPPAASSDLVTLG